jgi:hypothetical protein
MTDEHQFQIISLDQCIEALRDFPLEKLAPPGYTTFTDPNGVEKCCAGMAIMKSFGLDGLNEDGYPNEVPDTLAAHLLTDWRYVQKYIVDPYDVHAPDPYECMGMEAFEAQALAASNPADDKERVLRSLREWRDEVLVHLWDQSPLDQ